jgi:hypothetical protein
MIVLGSISSVDTLGRYHPWLHSADIIRGYTRPISSVATLGRYHPWLHSADIIRGYTQFTATAEAAHGTSTKPCQGKMFSPSVCKALVMHVPMCPLGSFDKGCLVGAELWH